MLPCLVGSPIISQGASHPQAVLNLGAPIDHQFGGNDGQLAVVIVDDPGVVVLLKTLEVKVKLLYSFIDDFL